MYSSPLALIEPKFAVAGHIVWDGIRPEINAYEFKNPHLMDVSFLYLLSGIRRDAGVPFRFISDARKPGTGAEKSAHNSRPCRAVDLQVYNAYERGRIVITAVRHGIVRIGPYPGRKTEYGNDTGGLHLDASNESHHGQGVVWTLF